MKHGPRFLGSATAIISFVAVTAASVSAQSPDARPTFSASVALVPITAVVRDAKSRIVRDLAREDFQVLENNRPRKILDFKATDEGPVSVGLLFDTSGSMRGPNLARGIAVVDRLLRLMHQSSDEIALFTFDRAVRQETPFTSKPDEVRAALNSSDAWGVTSLYDAIADAAKRLGRRPSSRRALVVITDGIDTSSTLAPSEVSALASATDVPVYVLPVMAPLPAREGVVPPTGNLADLATWTGGDLLMATEPAEADRSVATLMMELRQQYFLAIESSASTGWYRLDVTTKRRDLTVRTRSGYFAAPSEPD